jgi:DNA mismatch endonuclease, patch repair protein
MDTFSRAKRSEVMSRIRSKDTNPELVVRRLLSSLGYRYRLHRASLPGKPDLVFASRRKAIQVHGCFWHSHYCLKGRVPKSRLDYWITKLERNKRRDRSNRRKLARLGWKVLTVWECQLADAAKLQRTLERFLGRP